ncbi:MAG: sigma 54-interacting transcriptional regulator, partial [Myxococcota bacterium]|nr:sigma 54-interacting transcriptional regulator [Myxococcota bacterium]
VTLVASGTLPLVPALSERIEAAVEENLFPRHRQMRESLQALAREIGRLRTQERVIDLLRKGTEDVRAGASLHVVIGPPEDRFEEVAPAPGRPALTLLPEDPLHQAVRFQSSLLPHGPKPRRAGRNLQKAAMERSIEILLPLGEESHRVAALLVGQRPSGRLFDSDDVELLVNLAGPIAVALENAARLEELEELRKRVESENLYLRTQVDEEYESSEMVGRSQGIRSAIDQLMRVAQTDASVLIVGETGTGKELAVRTLHRSSQRADRVMVKLACAALPENLLESELFGHEKGAFTGADRAREGRFEIADGGTIFFDDVDTLSLSVQAKLLRAIQEGEVQRLGSNEIRQVDVRIVAATNRRLEDEVSAGRFREDLFYRLAVVPVHLPPLRDRPEDIPLLVEHLVRTEGQRLGRNIKEISSEALRALQQWTWPGNIRELRNVIERALVLSEGDVLRLPGPLGDGAPASGGPRSGENLVEDVAHHLGSASLQDILKLYKRALIESALQRSEGNQSKAAEMLGLHRPSLSRMIRDLGIK